MGLVSSDALKGGIKVANETMVTLDRDLYEKLESGRVELVGIAGDEIPQSAFDRASGSQAKITDTTDQHADAGPMVLSAGEGLQLRFESMNAKTAVAAIANMDAAQLEAARTTENARKDGARKSVAAAFDARAEELKQATA
jgi:hypothetical protein